LLLGSERQYVRSIIPPHLNIWLYICVPLVVFTFYYIAPYLIFFSKNGFTESRIYFYDQVHFVFSLVISSATIPLASIYRNIGLSVIQTRRALVESSAHDWETDYFKYRSISLSIWIFLICGFLSCLTVVILLDRVTNFEYSSWWGNLKYGYAGYYFVFAASQMVFWGAWAILSITAFSVHIARISKYKIDYSPAHHDNSGGLRPLGFILLLIWWYSLSVASAVYIVFSQGYLGIEKNYAIWILAITVSICVPLIGVLPLIRIMKSIDRAKETYIRGITINKDDPQDLILFIQLREAVLKSGVIPFKARAFFALVIFNGMQLLASMSELFSK
jgi:hypothetical protein